MIPVWKQHQKLSDFWWLFNFEQEISINSEKNIELHTQQKSRFPWHHQDHQGHQDL